MQKFLFEKSHTVLLADTDAAGRVYFARPPQWIHGLWEEFLTFKKRPLAEVMRGPFHFPIVNFEIQYKAPLALGDQVILGLVAVEKGQKSMTVVYEVTDRSHSKIYLTGKITHICVDTRTGSSALLPSDVQDL